MPKRNNRTVVDLKKVAYVNFFWSNGKGNHRIIKPKQLTYNGTVMPDDEANEPAVHHPKFPDETNIARLKRLGMIDIWIPVCRLQLSNTHALEYTSKKAISIWKEWNARIFGKKK